MSTDTTGDDAAETAMTLIRAGLLTAVAAAVAASVVALLLGAVGIDLQVPVEPGGSELQPLPLVPVVVAAALPVLVGTIVYALLRRGIDRPARVWPVVVAVVTLLSLVPVARLGGGTANQLGLGVLHLLVGGIAAVLLPRIAGDA